MAQHSDNSGKTIPCLIIGGAAWYVQHHYLGPVMVRGDVQVLPAIACAFYVLASVKVMGNMAAGISGSIDWKRKTRTRGHKSDEQWAVWKDIAHQIVPHPYPAPFWGMYKPRLWSRPKPLFIHYASNAVTFGPSGSGKTVKSVLCNLMALYHCSKVVMDFKLTLYPITKDILAKRGEVSHLINLGGLHIDIVGPSACFNPLDVVSNNLETPGMITQTVDKTAAICLQLLPEPASDKGGESFWRDGARNLMGVIIIFIIITKHKDGTLGDALQMLSNDRMDLLKNLQWVSGKLQTDHGLSSMPLERLDILQRHDPHDTANFIAYFRAKAAEIASMLQSSDNKTMESFMSAAVLALTPFNIASQAHKVMRRSSFDPRDLKNGTYGVNVFIGVDSSGSSDQQKIAGLIMWSILQILKQHPKKSVPVYIIADESTNFIIEGLPSLQTWGRESGIRWHGYIQSINAYKEIYGENAVSTLLSETEIQQYLPGQRSPEMLDILEKALGQSSYRSTSHSQNAGSDGFGTNVSEDYKPLMNRNAIRRCKDGFLFVRDCRPIRIKMPSIAEISPWHMQQSINPAFGKKYLLPVKLRIRERKGTLRQRLRRKIKVYSKPT